MTHLPAAAPPTRGAPYPIDVAHRAACLPAASPVTSKAPATMQGALRQARGTPGASAWHVVAGPCPGAGQNLASTLRRACPLPVCVCAAIRGGPWRAAASPGNPLPQCCRLSVAPQCARAGHGLPQAPSWPSMRLWTCTEAAPTAAGTWLPQPHINNGCVPEWSKGSDSSADSESCVGSNPTAVMLTASCGPLRASDKKGPCHHAGRPETS